MSVRIWRIDRPASSVPVGVDLVDLTDSQLAEKRAGLAADLQRLDHQLAQMGPLKSRRDDIAFRLRKVDSHIHLRKTKAGHGSIISNRKGRP